MVRYVVVHGHFYQPPRENPWLELVEQQDSAWPAHDWNERITAECYAPNTTARVLDDSGRIVRMVDNYASMSFNVGPTLLAWMADHAPEVHTAIVAADVASRERFGGHGSAMAQVHNHLIMPLANDRDRRTQVRWGLTDFEHRFGRAAEGMWLAETAADTATLEELAAAGVRFTILSPYQAAATRAEGATAWTDVTGGRVDPTVPYRVDLPSGRTIAVYFYDGQVSQAVAFEGLLHSGDRFAQRLLGAFPDRPGPALVNIATDGESYGHHHRRGEMALAQALERVRDTEGVRLTNYAEHLALHPPVHEARIIEGSSWSCAHGVERWRSDCGCTNGETGGSQAWRAPLREALDWLRDELAAPFETRAGALLTDPWAARDDYHRVVLHRTDNLGPFLEKHAQRELDNAEVTAVLRLMELQRHLQLMYTSCGWFFDELSRIETVQVLAYAARAIQLADEVLDVDVEDAFVARLAAARSNLPQLKDGARIYDQLVRPAKADFEKVAAHFAISGLSRTYGRTERIGCYEVERHDEMRSEAGRARVGSGRVTVRSVVTLTERSYEYGVLHFGDHNFLCGVRPLGRDAAYAATVDALADAFDQADFPATIRVLDDHFGPGAYSLRDLFRDEQRRLLDEVLEGTTADVEATYRSVYRGRAPLLRFLASVGAKLPEPLRSAAEVVINAELSEVVRAGGDPARVSALVEEADRFGVTLDVDRLEHAFGEAVERRIRRLRRALDEDPTVFERFDDDHRRFAAAVRDLVDLAAWLPFDADLVAAQNVCWQVVRDHRPSLVLRADGGDQVAVRWLQTIDEATERLGLAVPE
jgi:alpha-amylase/alpha-mannosidase (GH57 family)